MKCHSLSFTRIFGPLAATLVCAAAAFAQSADQSAEGSSGYFIYLAFIVALAAFGVAFYFWKRSKAVAPVPQYNYKNPAKDRYENGSYEFGDVDADKELEWLRKAKKASTPRVTTVPKSPVKKRVADGLDAASTKEFQEKMRRLQYAQLPINSFNMLAPARDFEPLQLSSDPALISAIEQTHEEYEDDEAIRDLALRILAAFRTRNSVEALYQIALYDLSANLRSKAVTVLTEFDHESVFDAIVLACADPTREVRAAAARGLFRLNFDRAGAWTRIIESGDVFRMSHAARAAVEAGIVQKSFDRLLHEDMKISYEAFCLVALLIKSGEDKEIFEAISEHKDERVKFALLHVIKVLKDERSAKGLMRVYEEGKVSAEVLERVREALKMLEPVTA